MTVWSVREAGLVAVIVGGAGCLFRWQDPAEDFDRTAVRAVPRDAFPVFHCPRMAAVSEVRLRDNESVLGVAWGKEAKAYPIAVMRTHELGNDTLANVPIAVSW